MGKTYTAIKVDKTPDIDVRVDEVTGDITGLVLSGRVYFDTGAPKHEYLNIWPLLTPPQKSAFQTGYNGFTKLFEQHFLG